MIPDLRAHVVVAAATAAPYNSLIYLLAAVFAGGLLPFLYQAWRNRKRGPLEDRKTIIETFQKEIGSLKDLLAEYRLEAEVNKRRLEDYQKQLGLITIELAKAQARISALESELRDADGQHAETERQLAEAKAERDALEEERDQLAQEAARLRLRIKELEDATGITERLARPGRDPANSDC